MMSLWHAGAPLPQLCRDALWVGASVLIRSTLILVTGLLLGRALRRSGPAVASLVYRTTLMGVVLAALLSVTVAGSLAPLWRIPLSPELAAAARQAATGAQFQHPGQQTASMMPATAHQVGNPQPPRPVPVATGDSTVEQVTLVEDGTAAQSSIRTGRHGGRSLRRLDRFAVAAVSAWGTGTLLLLAWLGICHLTVLQLRKGGRPVTEGDAPALLRALCEARRIAPPLLLASPRVRSPFLVGLQRPAILLPASYERDFDSPALRAILAHELAHLARRDCAWNLLARLTCAAGWLHPLLWVLCRRLEEAGEELCDQEVLAQQCPPHAYADCLLALAERFACAPERALGVGVVPFRSSLGRRIQSILDAAGRPAAAVSPRLRASVLLGTAFLVAVSLTAVAAPAAPGGAAPSPSAPAAAREKAPAVRETIPAMLRGDARLDAKVTLAHKDRPLGEVLAGLGEKTGVRLVAGRETADDKVTLFLEERPAAEVLALLARHFNFQWQRNRGGYELTQDLASRARETAQRESVRAGQIEALSARMGRMSQMASTPREQLNAREKELDRLLADPKLTHFDLVRLTEERETIRDLLRPGGAAAAAIYRTLTPVQLARLRGGGEVRLSSADGSLSAPLVEAVQQAAKQTAQPGRNGAQDVQRIVAGITTRIGGPNAAPGDAGPPVEGANVSIQLTDAAGLNRPVVLRPGPPRLQLRFTLTSVQGTQNMRQMMPVSWSPTLGSLDPEPADVPALSQDAAIQKEVELPLPKPAAEPAPGGARGGAPVPAAGAAMRILGASGAWPADMPTLADVAEAIHKATGLEVLADSFVRDRLNVGTLAGRHPLSQILATIADALEYDLAKEGSLLRFRSRLYPQDRQAEVPERILAPWSRRVARTGAPSLDDLAELAASLNDAQCRGMQEYWGWYLQKPEIPAPPGLGGFADNRHHLRFWASLTPTQRREAASGSILPVERLNGLQRQAFQVALTSPNEGGIARMELRGTPTPAAIAAGGFSLRTSQLSQQVRRGTGADGRQMATVTIRPLGERPPVEGGAGINVPEGITLEPAGPQTLLDSFMFTYHLAGDPAPARVAAINLPRPAQAKP